MAALFRSFYGYQIQAFAGAKSVAEGIQAELSQIAITSGQVHDLIMKGKLYIVELGKKELLDERLEQLDGLTAFQKKQISKFRESAYDLTGIRGGMKGTGKDAGRKASVAEDVQGNLIIERLGRSG